MYYWKWSQFWVKWKVMQETQHDHEWKKLLLKEAFIQKVRFIFRISKNIIPNYYPELEVWICCLLLLVWNLNFKFRIVIWINFFLEIWRFEKHIALSEKKTFISELWLVWMFQMTPIPTVHPPPQYLNPPLNFWSFHRPCWNVRLRFSL